MGKKREISTNRLKQYVHGDKRRSNNPPVGLVTADSDNLNGTMTYKFDPHLDPQIQWAGKAEGISFEVDTVSLHVHQRVDPLTIIQGVRKKELQEQQTLLRYFESPENNPPIREAIEFYKHSLGWSNRLIAGDSLLVMNSLLEKERLAEKVQMIYIDPPYGIKYGSNFQPFVNKRDVKDQKDEDLTQEPEMLKAFRDTWELGIHSYLTYLRNNLLLSRELLAESGSIFVQISDENLHHVREIMDEVFGKDNFISVIVFTKTSGFTTNYLASTNDYIVWYAKDKPQLKYRQLFLPKEFGHGIELYRFIEFPNGKRRPLNAEELENSRLIPEGKLYRISDMCSQGETGSNQEFVFNKKKYFPRKGSHWSTTVEGLDNLVRKNRIVISSRNTTIRKIS